MWEPDRERAGRCALLTPDFLWSLVALAELVRLSLKRKAHTRLCPVLRGRKSGYAPVVMNKSAPALEQGLKKPNNLRAIFGPTKVVPRYKTKGRSHIPLLGPGSLLHLRISPCAYEIGCWVRRQVLIAIHLAVNSFSLASERRQTKLACGSSCFWPGPLRLLKRPVINSSGVLAAVSRIG